MPRTRWLLGWVAPADMGKPAVRRTYTWEATLYWHKPNMSRETAIAEARKRGAPIEDGGMLLWYPVWPRNGPDGRPLRKGAGSSRSTMQFD